MPTKVEKDALTGRETTGHEWDGIKELNNPLPKWWVYVFYATIAFSLVYFVLYPSIPWINGYFPGILGDNQRLTLERQMEEGFQAQAGLRTAINQASLEEIVADPQLLAFAVAGGRAAFADNCVPCHGLGGAGQAGGYPVLADDAWIWGGTLAAISETLHVGIRWEEEPLTRWAEMPAYGELGILTPAQISDVAHYVLTLSGAEGVDVEAAARGAETYEWECSACHGAAGEGIQDLGAPTLSDAIWLYGGSHEAIVAQITNPQHGVMPAWGGRLDDDTIKMLTVYVHALGGGQ